MAAPDPTPDRSQQPPWYLPRTQSQANAWIVAVLTVAIGALLIFGPKISGDETENREYLVILLLGAIAIVFAIFVVDRLRLKAGERLAARSSIPWRKTLRTEGTLRQLGASWTEAEGRLLLSEVDLSDAALPGIDLRAADLSEASLRNANLSGANLQMAYLKGADLRGIDLRRGNLAWASLVGVKLEGARLEEANLFGADLRGVELQDVSLAGALFDIDTRWPADFSPFGHNAEWVDW